VDRAPTRDAGGSDEDVDGAVRLLRRRDRGALGLLVAHIGHVEARTRGRLKYRLPIGRLRQVETRDGGALRRKTLRTGQTDARRGAGDERDLALETSHVALRKQLGAVSIGRAALRVSGSLYSSRWTVSASRERRDPRPGCSDGHGAPSSADAWPTGMRGFAATP
jgi:hypothetical protein